MDEETRARFEKETKEQFAAIGRFVQEFESAVGNLRHLISVLVRDPTRAVVHQRLMWTILHHHAMTAGPLNDIACALVRQIHGEKSHIGRVVSQFQKDFSELVELRNKIVHGNWWIGYAHPDDTDFSEIASSKGRVRKAGIEFDPIISSLDDFERYIRQAKELAGTVTLILICVDGHGTPEKMFPEKDGRFVPKSLPQ